MVRAIKKLVRYFSFFNQFESNLSEPDFDKTAMNASALRAFALWESIIRDFGTLQLVKPGLFLNADTASVAFKIPLKSN